jgi:beta-glucosidase
MAAGFVRGVRSVDGVATCGKHWAGYGLAEGGIDYGPAEASMGRFWDQVVPPFREVVRAGVHAIMPSFNAWNRVPSHMNEQLSRVLRHDLHFKGPTISDWTAISELIAHGVAADLKDAAERAIKAGVDMDMCSDAYINHAAELVREGKIPQRLIDDAVRRLLRLKLELGLFQDPYPELGAEARDVMTPENKAVALDLAERSMILLKNDPVGGKPVLPLAESARTISVIGPLAKRGVALLGHWRSRGEGEEAVTVYDGIKARANAGQKVLHAEGSYVMQSSPELLSRALEVAKKSDVIIAVVGETEQMSGEAASRVKASLPRSQLELLKALHETGKPVVAVLVNGRPLTGLPWAKAHLPAILEAWQPGTMGGEAVANVIFGSDKDGNPRSPSGRLTSEIPQHAGMIGSVHHERVSTGRPAHVDGADGKFTHGPAHYDRDGNLIPGHPRHKNHEPLYAFGEGLTYTTFEIGETTVPRRIELAELRRKGLTVRARVTNTGKRDGEQVVQVYLRDLVADSVQPEKRLVGFERVSLKPGQTKEVEIHLEPERFRYFNELKKRSVLEPGEFKIWVGSSSREHDLKSTVLDVVDAPSSAEERHAGETA